MDGIDRRALILGAAGSFGGAVAQELGRRGWRLRLLVRDPAHLARLALAEDAEIVVGDAQVERAIEAIQQAAHTGRIGDGKIFITTLEQALRIRTGETDNDAL